MINQVITATGESMDHRLQVFYTGRPVPFLDRFYRAYSSGTSLFQFGQAYKQFDMEATLRFEEHDPVKITYKINTYTVYQNAWFLFHAVYEASTDSQVSFDLLGRNDGMSLAQYNQLSASPKLIEPLPPRDKMYYEAIPTAYVKFPFAWGFKDAIELKGDIGLGRVAYTNIKFAPLTVPQIIKKPEVYIGEEVFQTASVTTLPTSAAAISVF